MIFGRISGISKFLFPSPQQNVKGPVKKLSEIENKQDKYMKRDFDKKDIWGIHFTIYVIEKEENKKTYFWICHCLFKLTFS